IVVFGLFAGLASFQAAAILMPALHGFNSAGMSAAVSTIGLLDVFCSFMIYHSTRRELWRGLGAALKFFGTTAMLGTATILFVTTLQAMLFPEVTAQGAYR